MSSDRKAKKSSKEIPDLQTAVDGIVAAQDSQIYDLARKKPLWWTIGFAVLGGLVVGTTRWMNFGLPVAAATPINPRKSGTNEPLFESEISAYPVKTSFASITSDLQIPECAMGESLHDCVVTVCDQVAVELAPLNKPKIGETTISPKDTKKLLKMIEKGQNNGQIAAERLNERLIESGLNISSVKGNALQRYLILREHLIERSIIRNCGGATAKVIATLSEQPIIKQQKATLEGFSANWVKQGSEKGGGHVVARIKSESSGSLTCDPWNFLHWKQRVDYPVGVYTEQQIREKKPPKCEIYQDQFWKKDESSYATTPPDISQYSPKDQLLYKQEIQRQDARFIELHKKPAKKKSRSKRKHAT